MVEWKRMEMDGNGWTWKEMDGNGMVGWTGI
jgi:hypothetical protein